MSDPVTLPTAAFFEEYPLLKKLRAQSCYEMPRSLDQIARPPINMPCEPCKANQTFRSSNNPLNDLPPRTTSLAGSGREPNDAFNSVVRAVYNCAACGWQRVFLLEFGPPQREVVSKNTVAPLYVAWVRKLGQSPPWTATLPREVEKALGSHLKYFERGLACEGAGFGLAALAYYRRVVEELVRRLSDERMNTLTGSDREDFVTNREAVRLEHSVKREIELIKDMVPSDARPGSVNPLSGLYSLCSEGIHLGDDEKDMSGKEDDEADTSGRVVKTRKALSGLLHHLYASRQAKIATSSIFDALK